MGQCVVDNWAWQTTKLCTFILEDFLEDTHGPCFEFEMGKVCEVDSYEKSLGKHVSFLWEQ